MRFSALFSVLLAMPCLAQIQELAIRVSGLNCASCSLSLPRAMKKIKGVESVVFRQDLVELKLAPKNTVELQRVRDELKGLGYTPEDAQIRVIGRLRKSDKDWFFEPEGLDTFYNVVLSVDAEFPGKLVEAQGRIAPKRPKELDSFLVQSLKLMESQPEPAR